MTTAAIVLLAAAWAPLVPAATLILEPLARTVISTPVRSPMVRWLEIGAGVALGVAALLTRSRMPARRL